MREGQEEEAVRSGAFTAVTAAMTMVDSEDGAAGGGQDLSCQAGEQRRHPGGRLNQLWAIRH